MVKTFALVVVLGLMASLQVHDSAAESVNQVLQWNRTLLVIVRTPGAQPATVHPTRSFAIMHAAMYDAVNPGFAIWTQVLASLALLNGGRDVPEARSAVRNASHGPFPRRPRG